MRKFSWMVLGAVVGVALAVAAIQPQSVIPSPATAATEQREAMDYRQLELFGRVLDLVRANYPDKPEDAKLIQSAINGMLSALDPHSSYVDAKSLRDLQIETSGEFGGLGLEVTMEDGLLKVVAPIDETPAQRAGIQANDIITHVADEPVKDLTLQQAVEKMRGPVASKIKLKLMRRGQEKPIDVEITRETIRVAAVRPRVEGDDVGYFRITQFNEQTTDALLKAIADFQKKLPADQVKGYVIDLRNNPGGLLDQAAKVTNVFLARGEIVSIRGRSTEDNMRFNARPGGDLLRGKPMIVLINGGSASASEIVAGALQDHKRATILGSRSFGKGSVQTIIPLGGENGALRLTTARYFTPAGRSIQASGISPDIEVLQDLPDELKSREQMSESSLRGHLKAADGEEQKGSQAYVPPDPANDKALQSALALLRGTQHNAAFPPKAN